ncbi:MAG: hypothetical protein N3D11_03025 [Candidatus Sumerlaeia bacterium]|nr:hypothetical protein [Candidatus Sumerlaeia bacterium]
MKISRPLALTLASALLLSAAFLACKSEPASRRISQRPARPLPNLFRAVPADTLLVFALTDLDAFRKGFKQTALNEAWEGPNMQAWRQDSWPKFKNMILDRIGVTSEEVDGLFHGDMLLLMAESKEPGAWFHGMLLIRPSTNKAEIEAFAKKLAARPAGGDLVMRWVNDVFVISDAERLVAEVEANLKAGHSPIEKTAGFGVLARSFNSKAFVHLWVNGQSGEKTDAAAANSTDFAGAYVSVALQKKGFATHGIVQFLGKRPEEFDILGDSAPSKAIRLVPPDIQAFISLRHAGAAKLLQVAKSNSAATDAEWKQSMAEANSALGVNVETDLPKMLGKEIALSYAPTAAMPLIAVYIECLDGPAVLKVIDNLFAKSPMPVAQAEQDGVKYKQITIPLGFIPLQIAWAQVGDFVVFATSAAALSTAASTAKSGKSLANDANYKQAIAEAGPVGWYESYVRPAQGTGSLGPLAIVLPLWLQQFNQQTGLNLALSDITNFQLVSSDKTPAVSRCRLSPDGIETQGYFTCGLTLDPAFVFAAASVVRARVSPVEPVAGGLPAAPAVRSRSSTPQ